MLSARDSPRQLDKHQTSFCMTSSSKQSIFVDTGHFTGPGVVIITSALPTSHSAFWNRFSGRRDSSHFLASSSFSFCWSSRSIVMEVVHVNWNGRPVVCRLQCWDVKFLDHQILWVHSNVHGGFAHVSARNAKFSEEPTRTCWTDQIDDTFCVGICL